MIEVSSSQEGNFLRESCEKIIATACDNSLVKDCVIAESIDQARKLWHMRESISEAEKKEGRGVHFDVSLPISTIPDFIEITDAIIREKFPSAQIVAFGHIGDGNIHYNMCLPKDIAEADFINAKEGLKEIIYGEIIKRNGSISAEHGVGVERKDDLAKYKAVEEIEVMKSIKNALDPHNIMNPGKIF